MKLHLDVRLLSFDVPDDDLAVIVNGDEMRAEGEEEMHFRIVMTGEGLVHLTPALSRGISRGRKCNK